jgi:hypothetical protein
MLFIHALTIKDFSSTNHVFEFNFFQGMVIEMLFNKSIQIIIILFEFTFLTN